MATQLAPEVLRDDLAVSLARAMATANMKARDLGVNASESLVSVTQQDLNGNTVWRINYGAKDYVNRRGGDLLIDVDTETAEIKQVLRGQ